MRFIVLKSATISFLGLLGILIPLLSVLAFTPPFVDDFEDYSLGSLGGQGDWYGSEGTQVVADKSYSGLKSVKLINSEIAYIRFDNSTEGGLSFWIYVDGEGYQMWNFAGLNDEIFIGLGYGITSACNENTCPFNYTINGSWQKYTDFNVGKWYSVQIKWWTVSQIFYYTFNFDFEGWQSEYAISPPHTYVSMFKMRGEDVDARFDTIGGEATPPTMEIKGVSPASGTTITNLDTFLTIEYKNFDWDIYNGFVVNFRDDKIGVVANSQQFLKADLDPSGTGSKIINLQDFNFGSNGQWYLTGLGFGTHLDIEGGMFLTTRGYVDFWTDELVKTPYYLTINVEGLPTLYTFTDPSSWYSQNVERFDTPTQLFTSFVGLLSPVFEKVGEFGVRVQGMFNQKEAYDRGYALGEIFPLINGYIQKIDLFFGGFPLASFFKYLILVMLAIFIVRAVMKFIPFLG